MNKSGKILFFIAILQLSSFAMAYESLYDKTDAGKIEIKQLPERIMLKTATTDSYFDNDNSLFRKLFRFISGNDIAMTVPVEVEITPGSMAFFVGEADKQKDFSSNEDVAVINAPPRTVAAIGYSGSYSEKNFLKHKEKLEQWLALQNGYEAQGEAYAVYWDGPFTPWFLKRAEVHIAVSTISKEIY